MESVMTRYETHGVIVKKHKDWEEIGIAITRKGSVVIFRDVVDGMVYAVYSNKKGKYHIHMPYGEGIVLLGDKGREVLEEVNQCLKYADCYIMNNMIYSINPLRLIGVQPFGFPPWRSNLLRATTFNPPFPYAKSKLEKKGITTWKVISTVF